MTVHEPIVHTYFSFLAGASSPKDLIKTAAKYGYRSLAITDFDGVYGIARAYRALQDYKRHHETDLKLHYGAEIHLNPDHELPILHRHTLVLIAMSALGYNQLCTLLTQAHERGKTTAWISVDELGQINTSDLIAIVPMRGPSRDWPQARWTTDLSQLKSIFGDRLYLSITRTRHPAEDARISPTLAASDALQIPFIFSQDVFFHRPHQRKVADLLTAIRCSAPLDQIPDQLWPNSERCLHPLKVLRARYASIPDSERAWANANALANRIHFDLSMLRYRYPSEMVPAGLSAQAYLTQEVWRLADQRYAEHIPESVKAILRHELTLVEQLEFADYFLTVYDIVSWARSQNILCQGRGSAANSAICFVLGITAIDPSQFDLLFERFISVERGDPPDIDVDFEHERREEVIQYIYSRYGRHRAAMVCNVICFKSRGALRFSGQALGIPEPLLDQAAQILNSRHFRASAAINVIQEIQAESPHELPDYLWTLWAKMADLIRGIPRHLGIHSGGFIISQHPITALSPVEPATMENRSV
ncbi:PHP domain-containing protein, partial [bacterium]|nr:PHP domain-containing protein [bacterium]